MIAVLVSNNDAVQATCVFANLRQPAHQLASA